MLKHISLGDLTKTDPEQPKDYGDAPVFHHGLRNAGCCDKLFFFYPRDVMKRHKDNDYKMTGEMLEDMRHDDDETKRIIEALELNIKKRFEQGGKDVNAFSALKSALWDTFKWQVLKSAFFSYLSELFALGQNSMLILMITFINNPDLEFYYGVAYCALFIFLMTMNTLCR